MDVTQKVVDLMKLALDERTPKSEAEQAAMGAIRLIDKYKLLQTSKRIDVAAHIINMITSPALAEEVASRAEKIVDSVDRAVGAFKKLADKLAPPESNESGGRGRRRRARRRERE